MVADIKRQIAEAHFGVADITGNNPNVLWELGVMIGYGKPVIIFLVRYHPREKGLYPDGVSESTANTPLSTPP